MFGQLGFETNWSSEVTVLDAAAENFASEKFLADICDAASTLSHWGVLE